MITESGRGIGKSHGSGRAEWRLWPNGWWRWALFAIAVMIVPLMAPRMFGIEVGPLVWFIAATPILVLPAGLALVSAFISRSVVAVAVVGVVWLMLGAWLVPRLIPSDHSAGHPVALTVMTSNLQKGRAEPQQLVRLVDTAQVDILALQEVTPGAKARLSEARIADRLPYVLDGGDNMIWSSTPITDPGYSFGPLTGSLVAGDVVIDGAPVAVVNVHPSAPLKHTLPKWAADQPVLLSDLSEMTGPTIALGDFNATADHRFMQDLAKIGYTDAARATGSGLTGTWPRGHRLVFWPAFPIDHVLLRNTPLIPASTDTYEIPGSDHLALIARFALPETASAASSERGQQQ